MKKKHKIGDFVLVKAGTEIWCIDIQLSIIIVRDLILKVSATTYDNLTIFGIHQELLYNIPGFIPTLLGSKDEYHVRVDDVNPYEIPKPWDFEYL